MTEKTPYNSKFYSTHQEGMLSSAEVVLHHVNKFYQPKSVVDVGCGQGNWLAVARSIWGADVTGYDGEWVDQNSLKDDEIDFNSADISDVAFQINEKTDLCISLEVAEHLPKGRAQSFVRMLTQTAPVILFSAAIPGQGGAGHVNERWQSYWVRLFEAYGFVARDVVRPYIWEDKQVEWWYRQNILVFIQSGHSILEHEAFKMLKFGSSSGIDLVHPDNYIAKMKYIMKLQTSRSS